MSYYSSELGLLTENLLSGAPGAESREVGNTTARPLMVLPRPPVVLHVFLRELLLLFLVCTCQVPSSKTTFVYLLFPLPRIPLSSIITVN